jgi:hypothetical protein
LKIYYQFFIHLFAYEFVYDQFPEDNLNDQYFDKYLSYWTTKNYLIVHNSTYTVNQKYHQQISLITNPFEQYARAYLLIYEQENIPLEKNLSTLIKLYQKSLLSKLDSQNIISILASSSNVLNNALRTLNANEKSKVRHMLTKLFQPISIHLRAKL